MTEVLTKRAYIARSDIHGWGLFARKDIRRGQVVDESPLEFIADQPPELDGHSYEVPTGYAVPKGDGACANSSDNANATWSIDGDVVRITATRMIPRDIEVTLDYIVE